MPRGIKLSSLSDSEIAKRLEDQLARKRAYNKEYRRLHPMTEREKEARRRYQRERWQQKQAEKHALVGPPLVSMAKQRRQQVQNGAASTPEMEVNYCPNCQCNIRAIRLAMQFASGRS